MKRDTEESSQITKECIGKCFRLNHIKNYKIVSPIVKRKDLTPEEAFKELMLKGLEKQITYIQRDIVGVHLNEAIRRWYKPTEDKKGFYCYLKYQNRAIPLEDGQAFLVKDLLEAKELYENLKKEVESNSDFLTYLFNQTKTMNIARGAVKS